jgi:hypothetical protein
VCGSEFTTKVAAPQGGLVRRIDGQFFVLAFGQVFARAYGSRSRPGLNGDPLFVILPTLPVALASSSSGDQHFCEIVTLCRPQPRQDWERARTAGGRFARDDKEPSPSRGNNYPENCLVKPPRRDTRDLRQAGMFGGKAPRRLAAQKSRPHSLSAPMHSAPSYFLCKWGVSNRLD